MESKVITKKVKKVSFSPGGINATCLFRFWNLENSIFVRGYSVFAFFASFKVNIYQSKAGAAILVTNNK